MWLYVAVSLPYLIGFLLLPGSFGALACLLVVHFLPRRRRQVVALLIVVLLLVMLLWVVSVAAGAGGDSVSDAWLRKLVKHLEPAQFPIFPSLWMTRGLMAGAEGQWADAVFFLL